MLVQSDVFPARGWAAVQRIGSALLQPLGSFTMYQRAHLVGICGAARAFVCHSVGACICLSTVPAFLFILVVLFLSS